MATGFGVVASPGVGGLQIDAGLTRLFDVPVGLSAQLFIIAVTSALVMISAISGVERSVKWRPSANLPQPMSLRMTPFRGSAWVSDWTLFFWASWISGSPFAGVFIARVSRGRIIKEIVPGTMLAPTLAAALWFSIFGGTALHS